ncbi:MAG: anti-sigma factor family protein [Phycisphaerae bacterium]
MDQIEMEYLISRYADGTLSEPERRKAIQLIESNPECRRCLAGHKQVNEVLADWSSRVPMLDWTTFDSELAKKIDQKIQAGNMRLNRIRRWLGAAAVAGLAGLIGATIWLAHPPARRDVPSFLQPAAVHSAGKVIPDSRAVSISLTRSKPGVPKAVIKSVTVTTQSLGRSVPPTSLASKKGSKSEGAIVGGLGVAPPEKQSGQNAGMADARTGPAAVKSSDR